jgi:hypothetical protein
MTTFTLFTFVLTSFHQVFNECMITKQLIPMTLDNNPSRQSQAFHKLMVTSRHVQYTMPSNFDMTPQPLMQMSILSPLQMDGQLSGNPGSCILEQLFIVVIINRNVPAPSVPWPVCLIRLLMIQHSFHLHFPLQQVQGR